MKYAVKINNFCRGEDGWLRHELNPEVYPRYQVRATVEQATTWPTFDSAERHALDFMQKYPNDWDCQVVSIKDNDASEIAMTLEDLKDIRRAVTASRLSGYTQILSKINTTIGHFEGNQGIIDSITTVLAHLGPEHDKELRKELQDKLKSLQPPESVVIRVTKNK